MRMRRCLLLLTLLGRTCTASILDDIPDVAEDDDGGADLEQASLRDLHREYVQVNGDGAAMTDDDDAFAFMEGGGFFGGGGGGGFPADRNVLFAMKVEQLFELIDDDKNKRLSAEEIKRGLTLQMERYREAIRAAQAEEAQRVLETADADSSGALSLDEWQAVSDDELPHNHDLPREDVFAFAAAAGGEGVRAELGVAELEAALFPENSPQRLGEYQGLVARRVIAQHDGDGDARLNATELAAMHMAIYRGEYVDPADEEEFLEGAQIESRQAAKQDLQLYDADEDRTLDEAELGDYLVPRPAEMQAFEQDEYEALVEGIPKDGFDANTLQQPETAERFLNAFTRLLYPKGIDDMEGIDVMGADGEFEDGEEYVG